MFSRPSHLFFGKAYRILINKNKNFDGIPFYSILYSLAIGIVGMNYLTSLFMKVLQYWGFSIVCSFIKVTQRGRLILKKTDLLTINRGLGWQLYDWAMYAMNTNTMATEEDKELKRKTYLTPEEIKQYIRHYAQYKSPQIIEKNKRSLLYMRQIAIRKNRESHQRDS